LFPARHCRYRYRGRANPATEQNAEYEKRMAERAELLLVDRRDFVVGAALTSLVAALFAAGPAAAHGPELSAEFEAALKAVLGAATPSDGGIEMDFPEAVENGDYVPLALAVASPMTAESHVKAIHLLSTANPRAAVATFRFSLLSGKARVTSRMRLANTQEVVAVAELSDGTFLMGTRTVDVKVGGCGI
jgi:sulfur-oxidizing protein SoxY